MTQRTRLAQVVSDFLNKEMSYTDNVLSTGYDLFSYRARIAMWNGNRVLVYRTGCSRTTNRYKNLLRDLAVARGIQILEV